MRRLTTSHLRNFSIEKEKHEDYLYLLKVIQTRQTQSYIGFLEQDTTLLISASIRKRYSINYK